MSSQVQLKEYDQIVQNTIMGYLNELRQYEAKARNSLTQISKVQKKLIEENRDLEASGRELNSDWKKVMSKREAILERIRLTLNQDRQKVEGLKGRENAIYGIAEQRVKKENQKIVMGDRRLLGDVISAKKSLISPEM